MPAIVHYEVYSYDSRGWTLQSRYPGDERDTAVHEAKVMEFSLKRPVRVIRETYYTESNNSEEVVTYTGRLKAPADAKPVRRSGVAGGRQGDAAGAPFSIGDIDRTYGAREKAKSTADFMFRLMVVMVAALGVAVIGTGLASLLFSRYSELGFGGAGASNSLVLFLIFLSLFLITAVPLVSLYVPLDVILGDKSKRKSASSFTKSGPMNLDKEPTPRENREDANKSYPRLSNPDDVVDAVLAQQEENNKMPETALSPEEKEAVKKRAEQEKAAKEEQERRAREQAIADKAAREQSEKDRIIAGLSAGDDAAKPKKKRKKKKQKKTWSADEFTPLDPANMRRALPGDEGWEPEDSDEDEWEWVDDDSDDDEADALKQDSEDDSANTSGPSPNLDMSRLIIMKFLGGAVAAIKTTHPQLDAYNKFGVNLYMAGACEYLAEQKSLSAQETNALVQETVEVIGTRPEQAKHLVSRLDSYRKEPRYHQMINAGRVAMDRHISGAGDPFMAVGGVMKDWNTPQSQQVTSSTVTILFTDMVGSTDLTQSIGDAAAQDVIRAHNFIVRAALSHHNGKEVKHTGDGIMASFDQPLDAVNASIEIQKRAIEHNQKWPKLPLGLRIGMNTGEPIIEENDYFGTTVQIAARVCAAAGLAEIWLSADSKNLLPATTPHSFFSHGPQRLKGVKAAHELFEVVWNDHRAQELEALKRDQAASAQAHEDMTATAAKPSDLERAHMAAKEHLSASGSRATRSPS
jgi:adenylate cyclase